VDWQTIHDLHDEAVASLKDKTLSRVLVTCSEMIFTADDGATYTYEHFRCGEDAMVAHFTAAVLEKLGFGDHTKLRAVLIHSDELLAFKTPAGWSFYTHASSFAALRQ
jgi:hypothetical protein